ncbi:TRAP transporter substrate-binding protein [Alkaliphilus serpentinus]|uniref:TRAP transporter substrate-binding protein n=1 Tax=Alkaliphilus serpentinus TaxID=1482731 RepID=A0A833HNI1_9FIRM|nr:TRAP transporter substrate-binding protein [Alkaliphilus serpentinus]KAB3529695.1 TRAP transporter substrate-binding protein [Alkaliphilus serpentinus]
MFRFSRKIIVLFMVFILVLGIVSGCNRGNSPTISNENTSNGGTENNSEKIVLKFAHDYTTNSPYHEAALKYKEILEEKTNGRIEVQIYPAQQLGSAREMIEGMQMGTIEMVWTPTAKYAGFDQKLTVLDLPFIFPSEDIMWEALEGEIGQELMAGLETIGIKGISFNAEGYKHFTADKPIKGPDFFKGMKIRTMEAPVIMAQFKAWGANPVPIDFAEVYNALQQKVVDGQENPIISNHDMKFYEVQDWITVADHAYLTYFLAASNKWFESLPKDLQDAVVEAGIEMREIHKVMTNEANEGYMKNMMNAGTQVYYMTPEEIETLKELSKPVYVEFRDKIGGELIDKLIKFGEERSK